MAAKQLILGGAGAAPSLDDVLQVVVGGLHVSLDSAAASRIKRESPPPRAFAPEPAPAGVAASACGSQLDRAQTRATLLLKLLSLVNGRSGVRLGVVEALVAMVNGGALPRLPAADTDAGTMAALGDALHGVGTSLEGGDFQAALAAAGLAAPPALSAAERAVVQDAQSASAGTGAICVAAAQQLLAATNAVAALSAEALQADVKALDAEVVEAQPLKGALDVADELRGMLEGSRQVNAKKAGVGALPAVTNVAQVHGAALGALMAAAAPVKAELALAALPPGKDGTPQQAGSPALAAGLAVLAGALLRVASLSLQRAALLVERLPLVASEATGGGSSPEGVASAQAALQQVLAAVSAAAGAARQQAAAVSGKLALAELECPSLAAAGAAYAAYQALQQVVDCEALTAVVSLRAQEGQPAAAPAEPAAAAAAAANGPADGGKKKDKKKDKGAQGMQLGKGTAMLRAALEAAAAGAAHVGDGLEAELAALSLDSSAAQTVGEQLLAGLPRVAAALDPLGPLLQQHLAALRSVIEANQSRRKPKIAKGARDFMPDQMTIREEAFEKITSVFKRHGAVSIDTPVFELRETLTGKYGEDSKLIYDLADQGGEILSLRYDLTVPFARYVALHGITNIKRYHIAKVYRRDQPQMKRGRFREFFQCDFDIAGTYPVMVPDAEVLKVLVEILGDLQLGEFEVKLNHRRLLDAMLDIAGVPQQKFRTICSAIDKLDKEPWEVVRAEMVEEKGLPGPVADRIGEFVVLRGKPMELLTTLSAPGNPLAEHPGSAAALEELRALFGFLQSMGGLDSIVFDLSLARGLDYYTGVIYEAVLKGSSVGSIAAGGRYDHLVGMFSGKEVPAVGVSIGIERVFAIMEAKWRQVAEKAGGTIRETETEVLVASIGNGLQGRRMGLATQLWGAGIKAEFGYKPNPKMADQLGYALKQGIPFMVLFGESELEQGVVKVKDLDANKEEIVPEAKLVARLQQLLPDKAGRRIVYKPLEQRADELEEVRSHQDQEFLELHEASRKNAIPATQQ